MRRTYVMKKTIIGLIATFLTLAFVTAGGVTVNAETKVKVNEKNFPNEFLRDEINDWIDENGDGYLSQKEMNEVDELEIDMLKQGEKHEDGCSACGTKYSKEDWSVYCIFNCKGLKYFKNMKTLRIALYNDYYELGIKCRIKNLKEINSLKNLKNLSLSGDKVAEKLDLTKLKNLETLDIRFENLKTINVKGLKKLKDILLTENKLKKVNLKTNVNLEFMHLNSDKIKKLDLSKNVKLKQLELYADNLRSINVKGCSKLKELDVNGNFKKIDLSKNTSLKEILIKSFKLEKVIFPKKNKIKRVDLRETPIKNINLKRLNPKTLKYLNLANTEVKKIDISGLPKIKWIYVNDATKVTKAKGQKSKIDRYGEAFSDWYKNTYLEYIVTE